MNLWSGCSSAVLEISWLYCWESEKIASVGETCTKEKENMMQHMYVFSTLSLVSWVPSLLKMSYLDINIYIHGSTEITLSPFSLSKTTLHSLALLRLVVSKS